MYTQYAENLLKTVSSTVNSLKYDVTLAKNCIKSLKPELLTNEPIIQRNSLPKLSSLTILAAVIGKLHVLMSENSYKSINHENLETSKSQSSSVDSPPSNSTKLVTEILPYILSLTDAILASCRSNILYQIQDTAENNKTYTVRDFLVLDEVICMSGASWAKEASLITFLPNNVRSVLDKWKAIKVDRISENTFVSDIIPAESYILATVNHHIGSLSEYGSFSINPSLKNLLHFLVSFITEYVNSSTAPENSEIQNHASEILISLTMDMRTEYLHDLASKSLNTLVGEPETETRQLREHLFVLGHTYKLIVDYTSKSDESLSVSIDGKILKQCIKYWEQLLEKPVGCKALNQFFSPSVNRTLVSVLLSIASPQSSQQFSSQIIHFFNKLFKAAEKDNDGNLDRLCRSVADIALVDFDKLQSWLAHVILGSLNAQSSSSNAVVPATSTPDEKNKADKSEETQNNIKGTKNVGAAQAQWQTMLTEALANNQNLMSNENQQSLQENYQLLRALTAYIVKESSPVGDGVQVVTLEAIIPIANKILTLAIEGVNFSDLMQVCLCLKKLV